MSVSSEPNEFYDASESFSSGDEAPSRRLPVVEVKDYGEDGSAFPLHRLAYYGRAGEIPALLKATDPEQWTCYDCRGNTALHVAAIRGNLAAAAALLDAGFPPDVKNSRRWTATSIAIERLDRPLALLLLLYEFVEFKSEASSAKRQLLSAIKQLPDLHFRMKWEVGSSFPGIGTLVKRFAPHDEYSIWKRGDRIRVDGTLQGLAFPDELNEEDEEEEEERIGMEMEGIDSAVEEKAACSDHRRSKSGNDGRGKGGKKAKKNGLRGLLPEWKRGPFSLYYDMGPQAPKGRATLANHTKRRIWDVKDFRRKEVSLLEQEPRERD
eukprot:CAMPEP_0175072604 /NCGR_PEP_ID=MMETSP0052_2-20121109/20014_1 /TAXON_ID=51329 ORGANISM="Polytomella parva, Strain SAG 63-3" /NCGR_SAMPLE_ID=MMETSP0052_2 /ASSEMBLY_ACC=CAM_ASM_000194 /LENGTH=322 /DNA_ID=CAMNT_0016340151 /DNA_START=52 /DNA_END=1017 /DNA_ORIENTATION=-